MENKNIPYRRLRKQRRAKTTGKASAPVLKSHQQGKGKRSESKKREFTIMSQNVTNYEHMLKNPHVKQNYIHWVVKLRQPIKFQPKTEGGTDFDVPIVFTKNTESRENFLKAKKTKSVKCFNSALFHDTISRKQCLRHLEENTLNYMVSLRDSRIKERAIDSAPRPNFCSIPFKERNQFPQFLTKDAMKKLKGIEKKEKETAFDGAQNFPSYPQKIMTEKNFNCFSIFADGKDKSSFPTIAWQMGLRS